MPRRILEGRVVSDKMDKTITVLVERRFMHPLYKKYVKRTDKYAAHDENNTCKEGEFVSIQECRPISKRKTWTVVTDKKAAKAANKKPEAPKKEEAKAEEKAPAKKTEAKKPAAKKTPAKAPKKETKK